MRIGKLPVDTLSHLLKKVKLDDRVLVGPAIGEDAAVIDYGETLLVAKTDPITFATDQIGWYAVNINANDIAVMGAEPKWFLATILASHETTEEEVSGVFQQIIDACGQLGVSLVGGHTEVTYGIDRPIVIGCMLGETTSGQLIRTGGAKPGDSVILTKGIAIEGTAVLAREAEERLTSCGIASETLRRAKDFIYRPGISVVAEARAARTAGNVSSMHDPTEGGLATGLREVAIAAGVGLEIDEGAIPTLPETRAVCECLGLDPLGLIASGSLLLTTPDADEVLAAVKLAGVDAAVIGRVVPKEEGLTLRSAAGIEPLPVFERDEIAKVFDKELEVKS